MKPHVRWDRGAYLTAGGVWICLALGEVHSNPDYSHIAFDIEQGQFEAFATFLRHRNVDEWQPNSSEGSSIYILDPDGHKLEIRAGSLVPRLESLKRHPYSGLIWY